MNESAIVTREKNYPMPGSNYKFAWKWIYRVKIPGLRESVFPTKAEARFFIKKYGYADKTKWT